MKETRLFYILHKLVRSHSSFITSRTPLLYYGWLLIANHKKSNQVLNVYLQTKKHIFTKFSLPKKNPSLCFDWFNSCLNLAFSRFLSSRAILQFFFTKDQYFTSLSVSAYPNTLWNTVFFNYYLPSSGISSCVRTVDKVMCLHTWRSPAM